MATGQRNACTSESAARFNRTTLRSRIILSRHKNLKERGESYNAEKIAKGGLCTAAEIRRRVKASTLIKRVRESDEIQGLNNLYLVFAYGLHDVFPLSVGREALSLGHHLRKGEERTGTQGAAMGGARYFQACYNRES